MNNTATNWEDVYRTQTARISELEIENAKLREELKASRWFDRLTNAILDERDAARKEAQS